MKKLLCALLALMTLCTAALAEGTLTTNGGVEIALGDLPFPLGLFSGSLVCE